MVPRGVTEVVIPRGVQKWLFHGVTEVVRIPRGNRSGSTGGNRSGYSTGGTEVVPRGVQKWFAEPSIEHIFHMWDRSLSDSHTSFHGKLSH